jgi:hypothetical protein
LSKPTRISEAFGKSCFGLLAIYNGRIEERMGRFASNDGGRAWYDLAAGVTHEANLSEPRRISVAVVFDWKRKFRARRMDAAGKANAVG